MTDLIGNRLVHIEKVTRYLLDPKHPDGASKARFFMRFGFDPTAPDILRRALLDHPERNRVASVEHGSFGTKSIVECHVATPDGRDPCIRSVWISEGDPILQRLVTAYPIAE